MDKIVKKEKYIKPDFGGIIVFYIFRTLSKVAPNILNADYKYFTERRAYEKGTKWYVEAKISPIKHLIANFIENRMNKEISKMVDMNKLEKVNGFFKNKL